MQFLSKIKATLITSSAMCLILGIVLVVMPGLSTAIICYGIGAASVIFGIINTTLYFSAPSQRSITLGAVTLILGAVIIIKPDVIISVLPVILGIALIINGASNMQISLEAKNNGLNKWWLILIFALTNMVLGVISVLNPFGAVDFIMIFIGISLIIAGGSDIFSFFFARKIAKNIKSSASNDDINEI